MRITTDPLAYPRFGLRLGRPLGWTAALRGQVIRLRAPDRRAAVAITVERRATRPDALRRAEQRGLDRTLRGLRLTGRSALALGGRPAQAVEFTGRTTHGDRLYLVVTAVRSRWRTFGVTVFRGRGGPPVRLTEISAVLGSIRFLRPAGVSA